MKAGNVVGILLCFTMTTAYADHGGKNDHSLKQGYHQGEAFVPKGLEKQDKVPPGLAKQGKVPPGWSKGNKADKDATALPTIGGMVDDALSVKKK